MPELVADLDVSDVDRLLQAEGMVRSYCGWHIAPSRTATVRLAGSGGRTTSLPSLHVTDVASVTCDGQLLDPANYTWSEAGVLTHSCSLWSCRTLEVTFTHGYDTVPPDVVGVVQAIATRATEAASPQVAQVGQVTYREPGVTVALYDRREETSVLDRYRLPKLP